MEKYQVIELIKESKLFSGKITDAQLAAAQRFAELVQRRTKARFGSGNAIKCVLLEPKVKSIKKEIFWEG